MINQNRANGVATRHEIKYIQEAANLSKESAIEITRMAEETLLKEYAKELVAKAEAIADVKKKELHKKQERQKEEWSKQLDERRQREEQERKSKDKKKKPNNMTKKGSKGKTKESKSVKKRGKEEAEAKDTEPNYRKEYKESHRADRFRRRQVIKD